MGNNTGRTASDLAHLLDEIVFKSEILEERHALERWVQRLVADRCENEPFDCSFDAVHSAELIVQAAAGRNE